VLSGGFLKPNLLGAETGLAHLRPIRRHRVNDPLHLPFNDGAPIAISIVEKTFGDKRSAHRVAGWHTGISASKPDMERKYILSFRIVPERDQLYATIQEFA
jgi:hypothetical protein